VNDGNRESGMGSGHDVLQPSENPWGDLPMPEVEAEASGILWGAPPENHAADELAEGHHQPSAPIGESTPPVSRRRALQVLGMLPLAGAAAALGAQQTGTGQQPAQSGHATPNPPTQPPAVARNTPKLAFFTRAEMRTVRVLADDVLPKDARSGSATDARVPEFMDFNLSVPETDENTRTAWRGGLRWLDTESRRRHGVAYASATRAQRHAILDDIAYPDKVTPQLRPGNAFFMRFRDMCASGFFSSAIGFQDLKWMGNSFNPTWEGCPPKALEKLGVTYDVMTSRVGLKPGQ
jgi:gluconate 2-dehydrogenase gamma chain